MTPMHVTSLSYKTPLSEKIFYFIMPCMVALFLGGGYYLSTIPALPVSSSVKSQRIKARFFLKEEKKTVCTQSIPKKKIAAVKKPLDLTRKPILKQNKDVAVPKNKVAAKKVRRVYGLRKVYSKGLGTGGSLSNAVVAKLGNTINKEIDTITATKQDIKGRIAPTTTVTTQPRFKKRITPTYTDEMKQNQVMGKVKARVLVDVDGIAKKIIIIHDLGYGTKKASIDAINKMMFEPATINNDPVAVWIPLTFRFEFRV